MGFVNGKTVVKGREGVATETGDKAQAIEATLHGADVYCSHGGSHHGVIRLCLKPIRDNTHAITNSHGGTNSDKWRDACARPGE